jgi:hypothetical protein
MMTKAKILSNAFKDIMAKLVTQKMQFNLVEVYGEDMDSERLLSLKISYLDKEIEEAVKELPNGK